jgi:AcrR family transcriptional regulator
VKRSSPKRRPARRSRPDGEESRQRILDAAAEIAGERGYDGTSIAGVSERSGLPASSIYWHFADKDQLLAAVIERSFNRWLSGMTAWAPARAGVTRVEHLSAVMRLTGKALLDSPDFLRLGLMLALERRPAEATARKLFLETRGQAFARILQSYGELFAELDAKEIRSLATLTMAAADGLFIAHELDPDVDLGAHLALVAVGIVAAAEELGARSDRSSAKRRR